MFRNILVPIDGSRTATTALEEAIELARSDGARLVLMSVAAPARWRFSGPPAVPYPTEEDLEREAWNVVRRAEALVPPDVPVSTVVRVGSPAAAIVARAKEGEHDLVVIGSHGRGLLGALVLGSVSRKVVEQSPVPVLVARRRHAPRLSLIRGPRPEVPTDGVTAGASVQAEPSTRGGRTTFLWLVAALLLEVEFLWWMFGRMYAP